MIWFGRPARPIVSEGKSMRALYYCLSLLVVATALVSPAHANRFMATGVKPAQLQSVVFPNVTIDGNTYRLAPGARIYDTNNRMVLPNAAPQTGKVLFKLDGQGNLIKLWILTPDEIARLSQ